jgi:hypothetical protein
VEKGNRIVRDITQRHNLKAQLVIVGFEDEKEP